jgi:HicB family
MARKPANIIQPSLRIREDLHRRLEQAAKKRGVSLNIEMTNRLKESFDREAHRTIDVVASDLNDVWRRFADRVDSEFRQRQLIWAVEALVGRLPAEFREREKEFVENVQKEIRAIISQIGQARLDE